MWKSMWVLPVHMQQLWSQEWTLPYGAQNRKGETFNVHRVLVEFGHEQLRKYSKLNSLDNTWVLLAGKMSDMNCE